MRIASASARSSQPLRALYARHASKDRLISRLLAFNMSSVHAFSPRAVKKERSSWGSDPKILLRSWTEVYDRLWMRYCAFIDDKNVYPRSDLVVFALSGFFFGGGGWLDLMRVGVGHMLHHHRPYS